MYRVLPEMSFEMSALIITPASAMNATIIGSSFMTGHDPMAYLAKRK
jgi:hypothetical protein